MKDKTKILLYDIETSPNLAYVWGKYEQDVIDYEAEWYMLSFAYKWLGDKKVKAYSLPDFKGYKTDKYNDSLLVKELWKLFDEADLIMGHNCISPETKILTADLRYVSAGSLKKGDKLVGFDEEIPAPRKRRRYKESIVTHAEKKKLPTYKITLSDKTEIKVTPEHKFLVPKNKANGANWSWKKAIDLKIGDTLTRVLPTWEEDKTYEGGYLSGVYDGEGCLNNYSANNSRGSIRISCSQKENELKKYTLKYLYEKGMKYTKILDNGSDKKYSTVWRWNIAGVVNSLKFLGTFRPKRLLKKLNVNNIGTVQYSLKNRTTVESIQFMGDQDIIVLSTSTKTYISNGLASHNCDSFDIKKSNARFIYHGLTPPSPYKTIDTKKVAKKYFKFNSNKLDDLGKHLGLGKKLETGGFELWLGCMNGDKKSWKNMVRYNKKDVELLEEVYLEMRPWINNHPNINTELINEHCPSCSSSKLQSRGYMRTKTGIFRRYQCQDCGAWSRCPTREQKVRELRSI